MQQPSRSPDITRPGVLEVGELAHVPDHRLVAHPGGVGDAAATCPEGRADGQGGDRQRATDHQHRMPHRLPPVWTLTTRGTALVVIPGPAASCEALITKTATSNTTEVSPSASHSPTWSSICGKPIVRLHRKPAMVSAASAPAAIQILRRLRDGARAPSMSAGMSSSDAAMLQQNSVAM